MNLKEIIMTVIAITKFRPHAGKANLVLQNMRDVVAEFEKMGMTARLSKDMLGPDAGCLNFSSFYETFTDSMSGLENVFSSDWWAKVQMRLDDNPSSDIVSPLNLIRTIAGGMHPSHRFFMWRWYLIKRDKMPEVMELFPALEKMCGKVDIKPVLLAPVTGEPMSSMVIGYGAESMNHAGKAIDEMGMSEEYQQMVRKGAELGDLHRAWMSIPA